MALKASIVTNYFSIVLGIFQVASILELNFVIAQINKHDGRAEEAQPPSLRKIAVTYLFATILSIIAWGFMGYWLYAYAPDDEQYKFRQWVVTGSFFGVLCIMLCVSTLILYCRMRKISQKGLSKESKMLRCFFLVFSLAYVTRVASNLTEILIKSGFVVEVEFDFMGIVWDAIPIIMLA